MKHFRFISSDSKGFTLVEIIVTLVAAGILGAIFIHFMGTALDSSWNSVEIVRDEADTEALMEQLIAYYVADINSADDATNQNALANIHAYNGNTIDGITITTQYIEFDNVSGNEIVVDPGPTDNLKLMLRAPSQVSPAVRMRHPLTTVLTNSRTINDPIVPY
ncbi:MAG: type II secretion system protein [Desulfobacterales bacterium]|jgi:prepilin-type N-terminal cleavage/methylation domain-containing protein